jgi:hypothetical protein
MTDSSSVIKSTLHEQERHRLAQTGSTLNATDQTTLSTNRGDQSQKVWNAYSGLAGISTQSTTTQSAWNMVNAGRTNVAAGTAQIQTVNSEEVKPFAYALPLIFTAEATTVTAGGAAVGASAVVASYSKGPVETVLDFAAGFFSSKPTPLNGQNNRYNSTGGSQAYNSGPTRYSTPRVSHTSSNTETSLLDFLGLGAVFSEESTGSYTNSHASGMTYVGKGSKRRSQVSGKREARRNNDPHIATDWTSAENDREAFKDESRRLDEEDGPSSSSNYNRIEQPGKKYRQQDGED